MNKSVIITQCVQNDFVKPLGKYDQLPNLLHVGYEESKRLMGFNPKEGPISLFMDWAYSQPEDELDIIHIRDWHDKNDSEQEQHLAQFGDHCIMDTDGAEFAFAPDNKNRKIKIVNSRGLNDFIGTDFEDILSSYKSEKIRVGLLGVWTEAKVTFLAYDLKTRYPNFDISVCSALTAGSSVASHYTSLDQLQKLLGINVFDSIGKFTKHLSWSNKGLSIPIAENLDYPKMTFNGDVNAGETEKKIIKYLFRGSKSVSMNILDGGFSGNLVLGTDSKDFENRTEVLHVLKIGDQEEIGKERKAFEKVEQVLGNNAPRIIDFIDYKDKGGIKYRYASMGKGKSKTFQELYCSDKPLDKIKQYLDMIFEEQLGRMYSSSAFEKTNLLDYYWFSPDLSENVRKWTEEVYGNPMTDDVLKLPSGQEVPNINNFYEKDLAGLLKKGDGSAFFSYVHGDLNGANIIIDSHDNVWIIDFFFTHRGHILKDLIKLENDLLYIYTPMNSNEDFEEALKISNILLNVRDLANPLPALKTTGLTNPDFIRTYQTLQILRAYYPDLIKHDRNPMQVFMGQLRYSVHTQIFDESNEYHKQWALYNSGYFGEIITKRMKAAGPIRVDWIDHSLVAPGKIGLTLLPGRKDYSRSLEEDIQQLKNDAVDKIVVLVTIDELHNYGVDDLIQEYEAAGFETLHFPIMDQMIGSVKETKEAVNVMDNWIKEGKNVMIHCVGGLGRSGMIAASYLKYKGLDSDKAIEVVRDARSPRAVESIVQEDFVKDIKF